MNDPQPELSVVIASHNAGAVLADCLAALARQSERPAIEVIVADSSDDGTHSMVATRFAGVRLLRFDSPLTVPELRGRAVALARGAVIAILDPYSIAAEDWARATVNAHARLPNLVIGGSVDKHADWAGGIRAWAIYFNEYGLFMPPVVRGAASIVPGSNVSYKRALLFEGERPRFDVFWKTFVNWEALARGSELWLEPSIAVSLYKPVAFGDYFRTRFFHGRCFAAMRFTKASAPKRWLHAASTPLLPALLCWRWTRGIWPKRRLRLEYLLTLPMQLALFSMWALGELCGYVRGGGSACRRLFY